jgi:hypothetical protein
MTSHQNGTIKDFEIEAAKQCATVVLDWKESCSPESRGVLFADADGVTLVVYPNGLISIPAVRTYHPPKYSTPITAAASATELWARQKTRDQANPLLARTRTTGHLGPIVNPDLKCSNKDCNCHKENAKARQKRARGGFNTNPDRCS